MHSIKDFNVMPSREANSKRREFGPLEKWEPPSQRCGDGGQTGPASSAGSNENLGMVTAKNTTIAAKIANNRAEDNPPPSNDPELEDKFTVYLDGEIIVLNDVTQQVKKCTWVVTIKRCRYEINYSESK